MATFVFSYRMPADYQLGRPDAIANWDAFFQGLGDRVVDRGKPASETAEVGHCGSLAKGCPALAEGAGVQVGLLRDPAPAS